MVFPKTVEELKPLLQTASAHGITPYILGAGTNVLAPDEGLQAIVICLKDALTSIRLLDKTRMEVFAGESMAKAAVFAKNHALTGLEFAHGIPGTLGGGVFMNAGAYGGEMKQIVESVTVLTMGGEEKMLSGEESAFAYRTSVYQTLPCVIVKAVLRLQPGDPETIGQTMRTLMESARPRSRWNCRPPEARSSVRPGILQARSSNRPDSRAVESAARRYQKSMRDLL